MSVEKSIAVLPFENLSSDPENEYFSDGMTEEIINALSQIEHLKVTARTSSFVFKNQRQDIRKIGRELGVSLILEGSVRKSDRRLRITAQLIRTEDGFHIWSENFDREMKDVFELQDEISLLIADKIREHCGHLTIQDHLVKKHTDNIKAYQFYLKGRYHYNRWDMEGFAVAAKEFEKSLKEDPTFGLPHFGAGLCYSFLGSWGSMERQSAFELAESYFLGGNQLNATTAYGYYSVAKHQFWGYWKYQEAYESLLKAYAIQPQDSNTNEFMAEIHAVAGNFSTALKYIETSLQIDPLSPNHYYTKANLYHLQGRFAEALTSIEKGLSIAPTFTIALEVRTLCLLQLGQPEAFRESLTDYDLPLQTALLLLYRLVREEQELELEKVHQLIRNMQQVEHPPLLAWDLYLMVHSGNLQEAVQLLHLKATNRMGQVINFKYDPLLKPLHCQEAFQQLAQKYFPANNLLAIGKKKNKRVHHNTLGFEEEKHYTELLLSTMEVEKYYLKSDLGLKELAEKINLHPNKLSWLLNERMGKNFYEFVNNFRLKEFQAKAVDPQNKHISILGLAYESGFNSKSVFNDYFKKSTGSTPKSWLKQQLKS
ncbi:MAG: helix-turn-helix domain-containing protein [Bacteroidota bacterium]